MDMNLKLLFFGVALCLGLSRANAAPGDTTWVQAHDNIWLDWYNNFDTTVTFPDGTQSYQRIYMVFTLGKYTCPGSPTYCASWDYTVQNFLMTPAGDTIELGRLITPYAKNNPSTPASWKRDYVFDVTDYYPLLKNQNALRIHYSGYSGGFTASVRFAFIEGQRDRDVKGIQNLWQGSWAYGNVSDPINNHLPVFSATIPEGTVTEALHLNVTGHGSDPNYCSEFCPKYYQIYHNGSLAATHTIWRDNCGRNELYPQSGTWIYDRANWCPGDKVQTLIYPFPVTAGATDSLRMAFQDYTSTGEASYTVSAALLYYGGWNKNLDASLEAIVAPTDDKTFFRENASCGQPIIRLKNRGATTLTALKISYGLEGTALSEYTWTGSLAPGETTEIQMPTPWELRTASGTNTFVAHILEVNGNAGDEEATNNTLKSSITAPATWKTQLVVVVKTNKATQGGVSETSWKIVDEAGNLMVQRNNLAPNTIYYDTVTLAPDCYRLIVEDEGCDGINWWANAGDPNVGTGYIQVRRLGTLVPYTMSHYFNGDYGCGFTQFFKTDDAPAAVAQMNEQETGMEIYPNPASDQLTIALFGMAQPEGEVSVWDAMGRRVLQSKISQSNVRMDVSQLASGAYLLLYQDKAGNSPRMMRRFTIAR